MGRIARTAKGELVDFELLAIKQQLASSPAPRAVEQRRVAIAIKDGVKSDVTPDLDMFAVAEEAAAASAGKAKQLKNK